VYQKVARKRRRAAALAQIKPLVLGLRRRMPRLGTRKLYHLLKAEFEALPIKLGRDGFNEYLRAEKLLVRPRRNYTKTTDSRHWLRKHPNLLAERRVLNAEQVFVSDITYIKSAERTHYLSLVTDAFSRRIMGYHLADDLAADSVVRALQMAVKERRTQGSLIHHSDRGLQYASSVYQRELRNNRIVPSMTDGYDCYQNALAERVNGILKQEFLTTRCQSGQELKLLIEESIDIYNNERPHLSLGMETPNAAHEKACESKLAGVDC
jgi:transposase InsO family protein